MASRILDLGDILTLIEQAQRSFDEDEARKTAEKLAEGAFTLEDFLDQLQQVKKMGNFKSMLGMLPGGKGMREAIDNFDEGELVRTEAIIRSMTPVERRQPKVLNGSRRLRIARGSGTTVTEVNQLMGRFDQAAKMMKTVAKGQMPAIAGMTPGMRIGGGSGGGGSKAKKGSKSGNPAKRAAENAAIAAGQKPGATPTNAGGSGFGLGRPRPETGISQDELDALGKFLGR